MLKKGLAVFVMALLASPLFADIELTTSINDVFHQGSDELAGSITMRVNADDFNDASTLEPVFIRITLDHQATLADTLVDQGLPDSDYRSNPIFLAMALNSDSGLFHLTADPEAVSIVRWVEGESALWIRVQQETSQWILSDGLGDTVAPRDELTVSWTFGVSARNSFEDFSSVDADKRNLPYNTRDSATNDGDEETDSVSTLLCVDLSEGNLESISTSGVESLLNFDPIAFDETAEADAADGVYRPGDDTGINFTDDRVIARGKRRDCNVTVSFPDKANPPSIALCVNDAAENNNVAGWVCADSDVIYTIDCERGGDFLDTDMFDGSYVRFSTAGDTYGFRFETDGDSVGRAEVVNLSGGFTDSSGDTTYRTMDVVWADGFATINQLDWQINVKVWRWYNDGPVDVDLNWSLTLVNHDGEEDDDPFDGVDQHRRCAPSEFVVDSGTWEWGSFVECSGIPAVLFFPYMPMLRGNDLFWSGLSLVNHGSVDFPAVEAHIYSENGDRFDAEFPALPVHNQYTWLLIEDADNGTIGFNGMGDHEGTLITPEPYPSTGPHTIDDFGTYRMSMFVIGNFEAEFEDDRNAGDLDGYMLVGSGSDIDGSYLPRNTEPEAGESHDTGHLPPNRGKRGDVAPSFEYFKVQPVTHEFVNGKYQGK